MKALLAAASLALTLPGAPLRAEEHAGSLFDTLRMGDLLSIMREEGFIAGQDLAPEVAGDVQAWDDALSVIYDEAWMRQTVLDGMNDALAPEEIAPIEEFFEADPGRGFVELELSARQAFLDPSVEEGAKDRVAAARSEADETLALVERYIAVNDLIEANVVGALNSNVAFYEGLVAGGAFDFDVTEEQILADVWAQEGEIRTSTEAWVTSFLFLAYGPQDPEALETYIAFSESEPGRDLNRALFAAFDGLFEQISFNLGRAAAGLMGSEEL